jgi:WD40 repeat protein
MPVCPHCSHHVAVGLSTCPFCQSLVLYGVREAFLRTMRERRWLYVTVLGALLALCSFWGPWLLSRAPSSGWDIALGPLSYGTLNFPGILPASLFLFWLVPLSALMLLSYGIARIFGFRLRWLRFWSLLLTCACFVLLCVLFVQKIQHSQTQISFWLTSAGFLLAISGLFVSPLKQGTVQTQSPSLARGRDSRRSMLINGLNLAGLLGLGGAGVVLSKIWRADFVRAHSYRLALSVGKLKEPFTYMLVSYLPLLAWSPDSVYLAEAYDGRLKSWKVSTGQQVLTYQNPFSFYSDNPFGGIAWSPDGQSLVSWFESGNARITLIIWDTQTGRIRHLIPATPPMMLGTLTRGVSWSPDSARLAIGRNEGVQIWDIARSKEIARYLLPEESGALGERGCASVAWSPDGRLLAALLTHGVVHVWDIQSGKLINVTSRSWRVCNITWAPDSKRLALAIDVGFGAYGEAAESAPVLIWDAKTNQQQGTCLGLWWIATCVTWSPDGTRLAAGGLDTTVHVWNATTGERLFTFLAHSKAVYWLAWSPDGKSIASAGEDNQVVIWDAPLL